MAVFSGSSDRNNPRSGVHVGRRPQHKSNPEGHLHPINPGLDNPQYLSSSPPDASAAPDQFFDKPAAKTADERISVTSRQRPNFFLHTNHTFVYNQAMVVRCLIERIGMGCSVILHGGGVRLACPAGVAPSHDPAAVFPPERMTCHRLLWRSLSLLHRNRNHSTYSQNDWLPQGRRWMQT